MSMTALIASVVVAAFWTALILLLVLLVRTEGKGS